MQAFEGFLGLADAVVGHHQAHGGTGVVGGQGQGLLVEGDGRAKFKGFELVGGLLQQGLDVGGALLFFNHGKSPSCGCPGVGWIVGWALGGLVESKYCAVGGPGDRLKIELLHGGLARGLAQVGVGLRVGQGVDGLGGQLVGLVKIKQLAVAAVGDEFADGRGIRGQHHAAGGHGFQHGPRQDEGVGQINMGA